jgi:hypothetical protein
LASLGVVWNCDVKDVFKAFRKVMCDMEETGKQCYLLVDAEFVGNRTNAQLAASYDTNEMRTLLFHPLEVLNAASKDKEAILHYDDSGTIHHIKLSNFSEYSRSNGEIKVDVLSKYDIDQFIEDYELDELTAKRYLLGGVSLANSKTVYILYIPKNWKKGKMGMPRPVLLGYSTRFDRLEFDLFLKKAGFMKVYSRYNSDKTFGYFLLRVGDKSKNVAELSLENLHDILESLMEKRKLATPAFDKTIAERSFTAIVESNKSRFHSLRQRPTALIRSTNISEGGLTIEKESKLLFEDGFYAISEIGDCLKGVILWAPNDISSVEAINEIESKYAKNEIKLVIARNVEEIERGLDYLGL